MAAASKTQHKKTPSKNPPHPTASVLASPAPLEVIAPDAPRSLCLLERLAVTILPSSPSQSLRRRCLGDNVS